jgi:hypothetical protein
VLALDLMAEGGKKRSASAKAPLAGSAGTTHDELPTTRVGIALTQGGIGARLTAFAGDHREPANASMTCEGPLEVIGTP